MGIPEWRQLSAERYGLLEAAGWMLGRERMPEIEPDTKQSVAAWSTRVGRRKPWQAKPYRWDSGFGFAGDMCWFRTSRTRSGIRAQSTGFVS